MNRCFVQGSFQLFCQRQNIGSFVVIFEKIRSVRFFVADKRLHMFDPKSSADRIIGSCREQNVVRPIRESSSVYKTKNETSLFLVFGFMLRARFYRNIILFVLVINNNLCRKSYYMYVLHHEEDNELRNILVIIECSYMI